MNDQTRPIRRRQPAWPLTARTAAAIAAAAVIAACGSSSPGPSSSSSSGSQTNPNPAQAQQDVVNFARCMRSHGISQFPDDLNFENVPGINASSPAFKAAQTACQSLLPVKTSPPAAPSAQTDAKLLRLSNCLRAHGYPSMPDPKPDPPPSHSSLIWHALWGGRLLDRDPEGHRRPWAGIRADSSSVRRHRCRLIGLAQTGGGSLLDEEDLRVLRQRPQVVGYELLEPIGGVADRVHRRDRRVAHVLGVLEERPRRAGSRPGWPTRAP